MLGGGSGRSWGGETAVAMQYMREEYLKKKKEEKLGVEYVSITPDW